MIPSLEKIEEREENIRERIKNISGDQRVLYYNEVNKRIKDPDTYATLNYFFIVGVHHFYLGKWIRGSLNIFFCVIGIYFIFSYTFKSNSDTGSMQVMEETRTSRSQLRLIKHQKLHF